MYPLNVGNAGGNEEKGIKWNFIFLRSLHFFFFVEGVKKKVDI